MPATPVKAQRPQLEVKAVPVVVPMPEYLALEEKAVVRATLLAAAAAAVNLVAAVVALAAAAAALALLAQPALLQPPIPKVSAPETVKLWFHTT
jgi:hypothetical protein